MVELRRPLGNVYTTLVLGVICALSLWIGVPAFFIRQPGGIFDVTTGRISQNGETGEEVFNTQKLPLALLIIVTGGLIVLRIFGIPFLPMRGVILNTLASLLVLALFVVSCLFITQTLTPFNDWCNVWIPNFSGSTIIASKVNCAGYSMAALSIYLTSATASGLGLFWRLFGGSF